jgi:ATP-binding cassette subfamily B protein
LIRERRRPGGSRISRERRYLIVILTWLITGALVAPVASLFRGRSWADLQSQIVSDLRFQVFTKIQTLSPEFLSTARTGEVLARFTHDIAAVDNVLTMTVTWGLLPGLDSCVGTLVLFVLDWRLALVATLVWPWCVLVPTRIAPRAVRANHLRRQKEADVRDAVEQAIAGHRVVRAYNLEQHTTRHFLMRDGALFGISVRVSVYTTLMDQSATVGLLLLQVATLAVAHEWRSAD